jgi:ABC-2 type transport system ATP-binding protein
VYGAVQALGPLTLEIPRGSVGLLGPNGSGKTTLVRILLGILPPTSGSVRVLGDDVNTNRREFQKRIGYAPEGDAVFPGLSGVEAVAYAGRLVGMRKADAIERAHQVIDFVELGEARYRLVEKYSTGMRQRLKLAQALVHDPELLVLDEPTEGVDPEARAHILGLIEDLVKTHGLNLLLSTHQLGDVERLASHAVVLDGGLPAAQGTLAELRAIPTKSYLVRVNGLIDPLTERLSAENIPWHPLAPNIRVDIDDPKRLLEIIRETGLVLRHLAPAELSLGEAFERAVGGEQNG